MYFGSFTLRQLQIIERAVLLLQNIELNQGYSELEKVFPKNFVTPETYWELKRLEDKIIEEKQRHVSL